MTSDADKARRYAHISLTLAVIALLLSGIAIGMALSAL
jgi:hypothetical protein